MSSALHADRLVPCLVAALLVTAGVPVSVTAASAAETADATNDPEVGFTDSIYHEQRGDVVEVGLSLSGTDAATISFGPDANASATIVVRDEDGDGRATVLLNTYDWSFRASDGDAVTVWSASNVSAPLSVGVYDVLVCPGETPDCEREAAEATRLTISERSTDDLQTWVAPRSAALSNLSAIDAAKASGNLTRSETVTTNATLVFELRASGLEGALAEREGPNVTAAFFDALEDADAELRARQTNPGPEVRAAEIHLSEHWTRVVADAGNDTYYVVADLREANVTRGDRDAEIRPYHEYEVNFSVAGSSALASNGTESVTANFTMAAPVAKLSTLGERREFVSPASNRSVYSSTSLPPGTAVTVELASKDGDHRLSETVRVRNASDGVGEFTATFDFSAVPSGTNFTVDVRAESYPDLDFETVHVVVSKPSASVAISTVKSTGVSIDATLSHGGFVAVHRGSEDGAVLGSSQPLVAAADKRAYLGLEPDLESNATLVAVAYRDTDRDGEFDPERDEPYASEGSVVADSATVTVEPTTADPTTRATTDAPIRDTETTATRAVAGTTAPGGDGPISGFGAASALAALAALLALTVLARRR